MEKKLIPIKIILLCDKCEREMERANGVYPYSYTCPKCHCLIENEEHLYPRIEYEEIE